MSRTEGDRGRYGHAGRKRIPTSRRGYCSGCMRCSWFPKRLQPEGVRTAKVEAKEIERSEVISALGRVRREVWETEYACMRLRDEDDTQ